MISSSLYAIRNPQNTLFLVGFNALLTLLACFLIGTDGTLKDEWRGLKVPGHVDDVLKAVKDLKKIAVVA